MSPTNLFLLFLTLPACMASEEHYQVKYFDSVITIDAATCRSQSCTVSGLSCSEDCTSVQICMNGNQVCDTYVCDNGTYCDSNTRRCNQTQPVCSSSSSSSLQCMEAGIFPDPYNCNQYYCCNGVNDPQTVTPTACPNNTNYDYRYGVCRATNSALCASIQCFTDIGHTQCDYFPDNPYLTYVCMSDGTGELAPVFFNCASGQYDSTNCICSNTSAANSNFPRNIAAVTCSAPDNSSTSTSTTSTTPSSAITCTSPYDFYAISNDNCRYCYCTTSFICDIRECLEGTYFNSDIGRCVVGTCTVT